MLARLRKKFSNFLNGGMGPGDPRMEDRVLMGRIRVLNGYALFQTVAVLLSLLDVVKRGMWLSVASAVSVTIISVWSILAIRKNKGSQITAFAKAQIAVLTFAAIVSMYYTGGLLSPTIATSALILAYTGIMLGIGAVVVYT